MTKPQIKTVAATLIIIGCTAAIGLSQFGSLGSNQSAIDQAQILAKERSLRGTQLDISAASATTDANTATLLVGLLALLGITVLALIIGWMVARVSHRAKLRRDEQRRQDLHRIAAGFELYRQAHGHYPKSSAYNEHYYSVISLVGDWQFYQLPSNEELSPLIEGWPLLDPLRPAERKDQKGQYLYFPHQNGQSFDLYASLEAPLADLTQDYNTQDGLPLALGVYNFKVSSQ
jgi:hypothetical protein